MFKLVNCNCLSDMCIPIDMKLLLIFFIYIVSQINGSLILCIFVFMTKWKWKNEQ